ncbi:hypothetical protein [Dyadobacter diqingensis]|uniref:hypothetical protein n=1 Tax=Dyadobacter diqingensis TaxID=2938121 RepID=UPI0020C36CF3|nr:hypothetical protein [Dyadobacter diqingensis]
MQEISISGQVFQIPENWQEVESKRLPELLKNLYVLPESGSTYHNILRIVLGFTPKQWKKLMQQFFGAKRSEEQKDQSTEALCQLLNLVSWLWTSELTTEPFRKFRVDGQYWHLFEEGFRSMTFGEMCDAYIHAQAFIKQLVEGEERLNLLVATICRPERAGDYDSDPSWNGDTRENYNEHLSRRRADLLKDKYMEEKVLVMVYFLGTVKNFFSYFDLFDDDGSSPSVPEEFPGQSMIKNQHLLSQKQVFGSMDATKSANVHEVFQFLEEHNKDVKAEIARHKANQD